MERLRNLQREGLDYHLETEWHRWIYMEGRKRIATLFFWWDVQQAAVFGREACQTAFELQAGLPSGKEEVLWDSNCASDWITCVDTEAEVPTFLGVLRYFFDEKKPLPHLSPLASVFILHGLISIALDLKKNRLRNPEGAIERHGRILQAFERWRQQYEKTVAIHLRSPCHNKIMVMYHMAFVAMHTDIRTLLIVAGETRVFTRDSNNNTSPHQQQQQQRIEFYHAKNEMTAWANSPNGQLATWHAVQILLRLLGEPALVREQVHLPWMQYLSLLICWAYGNLLTNHLAPQGIIDDNGNNNMLMWNSQAAQQDMQAYIEQMNKRSWQELTNARGVRRTTGLIMTVKENWEGIHWGLLQQSSEILRTLAARNSKVGI
ncbi:hypothetical protein DFH27DRAFT_214434 [Peziza echinospora]|nr:hypothetical protein DFH27DRAFT_214434 [Peziza echinospora]